jgi:biotin operon repressor
MATQTPPKPSSSSAGDRGRDEQGFWLALSDGQVQELVQQEAARRGAGRGLLGVLLSLNGAGRRMGLKDVMRDERYHDRHISQSVIRSLLVLSAFALGEAQSLNGLAEELGMGTTTLWRYLKTWVAVGVLEERRDRRYQLAVRWRDQLPKITRRRSTVKVK